MRLLKLGVVNAMTIARIFAAISIVFLMYHHVPEYAIILFGIAAGLDFLDGYLARLWDVTTPFGALLDPIADKFLVLSAVGALLFSGALWSPWTLLPTMVIVVREGLMLGVPLWRLGEGYIYHRTIILETTYEKNHSTRPPVTDLGKWKMAAQCVALFILIGVQSTTQIELWWVSVFGDVLWYVGVAVYWIAGYLTFITGIDYLRKFMPELEPWITPVLARCWIPTSL